MKRKVGDQQQQTQRKRIGAYEKHQEIGRGTYGTVYLGIHHEPPHTHVAIKKIYGHAKIGHQEAKVLKMCAESAHVVNVGKTHNILEVVEQDDKLYLILEYMDSDLETIIKATDHLPDFKMAQVKTYLHMLLQGVQELHSKNILHRDLKPNNLLVSKQHKIAKISDFGMATLIDPEKTTKRSIQVVTRAYRAPELFFGDDTYGFAVDMWSTGCIFAEMLLRRPFFDGASDIDQLSLIFAALGSPSQNGWEAAAKLPFYLRFKDTHPLPLQEQFPALSTTGVDLLSKLLRLDPTQRISAQEALQHPFFQEEPAIVTLDDLVIIEPPERMARKKNTTTTTTKTTTTQAGATTENVVVVSDDNTFVIKGRRIV